MNPHYQNLTKTITEFIQAEVAAQVEKHLAELSISAPVEVRPHVPLLDRGAVSITEAAFLLGICEKTVHTHTALKKLKRTAYGTITVESIKQHLASQTAEKKARKVKAGD